MSSAPLGAASIAARYATNPADTLRSADARGLTRLKEAGAVALCLGVGLSFLLGAAFGVPLLERFLSAGWTAAWALARLFIMRTAARGELARHRRRVDDAWGPSLMPFAVAVAEPLGVIALLLSGWLTFVGLNALGTDPRETRWVVAWGFGGQLAVEIVTWIARGGLLLVLAKGV